MDPLSSVRVEVDGSADASVPAPSAPDPGERGSRRTVAFVVGALLAIGVAVVVFALRPSEGETAAGTQRQATTTTVPETTTVAPPTTVLDAPVVRDVEADTNGFDPQFNEIVRAEIGFLGLGLSTSPSDAPDLFRSVDGSSWAEVDVTITDDEAAQSGGSFTRFSNLIRLEDGFALLRVRSSADPLDPEENRSVTERLVSPDGATWVVDEGFLALEDEDNFFNTFHVPDAFGSTIRTGALGSPVGELLTQMLVEAPGIDLADVCFVDGFSVDEIRLFECGRTPGEGALVRAEDLIDPETFDAVQECLVFMQESGLAMNAPIVIQRGGQAEPVELDYSFSFLHTPLPGGAIASFFVGDLFASESEECDDFPGVVPELDPASVSLILPDNTVRLIPLPQVVRDSPDIDNWLTPSFFGFDSQLLAVLERSVWQLDLDTETWSVVADFPLESFEFDGFGLVDRSTAVAVGPGAISVIDLETGEITDSVQEFRNFSQIVFVDDQVAILSDFSDRSSVTVVDLPQ